MKETFYFSHDYNSRADEKIKKLIRRHGMTGYGIYWAIIEDLYQNANALQTDCDGIAFDLRVDVLMVTSILNDFDLFVFDGDEFGSMSVQRRFDERINKSQKARESANKRWGKMRTHSERIENECERNAIKERKGKDIKEKEKKVKDKLISEIKISDVPASDFEFYQIANAFHQLFEQNIKESGGTLKNIQAAKYSKWVSPIRLMIIKDKIKKEDIQLVFKFLQNDEFWKPNVQSTQKLREKFNTIIGQAKRNGNTKKKSGLSPEFIANIYNRS